MTSLTQDHRLCMKAEDWRMHMRSIRSMATRAELYGNKKEAELLHGLANRIERDLHGLADGTAQQVRRRKAAK